MCRSDPFIILRFRETIKRRDNIERSVARFVIYTGDVLANQEQEQELE